MSGFYKFYMAHSNRSRLSFVFLYGNVMLFQGAREKVKVAVPHNENFATKYWQALFGSVLSFLCIHTINVSFLCFYTSIDVLS